MKRSFRDFLGFTNVRGVYAMATAEQGRSTRITLNTYKPEDWITLAFNFSRTREGVTFWNNVDAGWREWAEALEKEARL